MDQPPPHIAIIGTGDMGSALAARLTLGGAQLSGFDPDRVRADAFSRFGRRCESAGEAVDGADLAVSLLPDAAALHATARALGFRNDLLWLEASTLALDAKRAARDAAVGVRMIDGPISGTAGLMAGGEAVLLLSGAAQDCAEAAALLSQAFAAVHIVGDFLDGARLKLVANQLVALHTAAAAEAVLFCRTLGLDPGKMIDTLAQTPAGSRMLALRGPRMAAGAHHPATGRLRVIIKDIDLIETALAGAPRLPMTAAAIAGFRLAAAHDDSADLSAIIDFTHVEPGEQTLLS